LFPLVVGESSKSRKGTSWNPIRTICSAADPKWGRERISTGLSSGEGLQLSLAFMRIKDSKVRRRILELVRSLAGEDESEH